MKIVVMKIEEREPIIQALGLVYGAGRDGFPGYVSLRQAATNAVGFAAITSVEELALRHPRPMTTEILTAIGTEIIAQYEANRMAVEM